MKLLGLQSLTPVVFLAVAWVVVGCGVKAVTLEELPVFPGAVELRAGETKVGDTLARNAEQDAAVRQAVGAGGSTRAASGCRPAPPPRPSRPSTTRS